MKNSLHWFLGIYVYVAIFLLLITVYSNADELLFKFKSPAFSGINTSSHYLTIDSQEASRKQALKEEIQAYKDELARDASNTTLARFIRNLESRIYAQLSRQMVEQLFGETPQKEGKLELEGNTIEYKVENELITLTITDEMVALLVFLFLSVVLLSSCASRNMLEGGGVPNIFIKNTSILELQSDELRDVKPAKQKPVVAVYPNSFVDYTGQRKSNGQFALFSTAISQAPDAFLIRALKHSGNGNFWTVVERVGLDSLTKERQIIRSTRDSFEEDSTVKPLIFAGLLMQGGVLSYDTNILSGGAGARYLGIGSSKQYREDLITVSLRLVSVSTGEILIETSAQKSLLSVAISQDVFRFLAEGQRLIEVENGKAQNESTSLVLQSAIEECVLDIIKIGIKKGYWKYE